MTPKRSIGLFSVLCIGFAIAFTACANTGKVTLAPGGVYKDATLATIDTAITDADDSLNSFVVWANTYAPQLAKYPAVGAFAAKVTAEKKGWINLAWTARKDYAATVQAYRASLAAAVAAGQPPPADKTLDARAAVDAALNLLKTITAQIPQLKAASPVGP